MIQIGLVVVAAGRGDRLGSDLDKARVPILGRPMLAWTLEAFNGFDEIVERVVVVPPGKVDVYRTEVVDPLALSGDVEIVEGGEIRQDSVARGLAALSARPRWIMVHDAARPLVPRDLVERVIQSLDGGESVVPALPLRDSIARIGYEQWLKGYVDRSELLAVQTPQGFHRPVLEYAHEKARSDHMTGTDEASLVLHINHPVSWIEGDVSNLKVTYAHDISLAETILRSRSGGS